MFSVLCVCVSMTTRCLSDVYGGNVGHLKNIHELTGSDFAGFAIPVDFYIGLAKKQNLNRGWEKQDKEKKCSQYQKTKKQDKDREKKLKGSLQLSHVTPVPLFISVPASLHSHSDSLGLSEPVIHQCQREGMA